MRSVIQWPMELWRGKSAENNSDADLTPTKREYSVDSLAISCAAGWQTRGKHKLFEMWGIKESGGSGEI